MLVRRAGMDQTRSRTKMPVSVERSHTGRSTRWTPRLHPELRPDRRRPRQHCRTRPRERPGAGSKQGHRLLPDGAGPDPGPVSDGRPGQHVGERRPRPVPSAERRNRKCVRGTTSLVMPNLGVAAAAAATAPGDIWRARGSVSVLPVTPSRPPARGATASVSTRRTRRVRRRCGSACRKVGIRHSRRHRPRRHRAVLYRDPGWHRRRRPATTAAPTPGHGPPAESSVIYRETAEPIRGYDSRHIQITLVDFSGPHKKLLERGVIIRGKRPAPVPLPRHRRRRHQRALSASSTKPAACATRCSAARSSIATPT